MAEDGAHRAVGVDDGQFKLNRFATFQRWACQLNQLVVERQLQAVILRNRATYLDSVVRFLGGRQYGSEVQTVGLPVAYRRVDVQRVGPADHLVDRAETQLRHNLSRCPRPP